jgi:hypothetical protein
MKFEEILSSGLLADALTQMCLAFPEGVFLLLA